MELNQRDEKSPFRNANLRKAISYSIDRKALVESILGWFYRAKRFSTSRYGKRPKWRQRLC